MRITRLQVGNLQGSEVCHDRQSDLQPQCGNPANSDPRLTAHHQRTLLSINPMGILSLMKLTSGDRGIIRVSLDVPGRPMNILNQSVMTELQQIVSELEANQDAKLVVLESGKESGFLAGADVNAIANIESSEQALGLMKDGQAVFQRIAGLKIPTIAVIHGPCLGGGLELALSCKHRIARDNSSTKIGLPEIKLGVIPGWGGTQRLPKLVGLTNALAMILQGKHIAPRDAVHTGLIDMAIAPEDWEEEVDAFIHRVLTGGYVLPPRKRRSMAKRFLEGTKLGRYLIFDATGKQIASKAKQYPALASAVKAISDGYQRGVDGFASERQEFVKLLPTMTCRNLLNLFFARESARSLKTWSAGEVHAAHDAPIQKVGVVGGGAMGAGIAQVAALRGFDVVVKEINADAAAAAGKRIEAAVNKLANRKGWSDEKRRSLIEQIDVTCDDASLADSDLVVEAIVERLDVKQGLFRELGSLVKSNAILATNTSSLSVDDMAVATGRPANFGGLHFFNPVYRMELVEVVRGQQTSDETIARLVSFVRGLGKTPIVTSDSPGFLVNRVLFPYLGEAVMMVREGYDVVTMDKELRRFGMPMGPLELLDQVGIDVAHHVASSLSGILPGVDPIDETLMAMVGKGQLGKKSGAGFYQYCKGKKGKPLSTAAVGPAPITIDEFPEDGLTAIQRRLVYPMLRESIRCLEEHVVDQPWAIDLAMVLGTGFAPHRGGPLHVVDQIGAERVLANTKRLAMICGPRFAPPEKLIQMAAAETQFFEASRLCEQTIPNEGVSS